MADSRPAGEIDLGAVPAGVEEALGGVAWENSIICGVFPCLPADALTPHSAPAVDIMPVVQGRWIVERIACVLNELLRHEPDAVLSLASMREPSSARDNRAAKR